MAPNEELIMASVLVGIVVLALNSGPSDKMMADGPAGDDTPSKQDLRQQRVEELRKELEDQGSHMQDYAVLVHKWLEHYQNYPVKSFQDDYYRRAQAYLQAFTAKISVGDDIATELSRLLNTSVSYNQQFYHRRS